MQAPARAASGAARRGRRDEPEPAEIEEDALDRVLRQAEPAGQVGRGQRLGRRPGLRIAEPEQGEQQVFRRRHALDLPAEDEPRDDAMDGGRRRKSGEVVERAGQLDGERARGERRGLRVECGCLVCGHGSSPVFDAPSIAYLTCTPQVQKHTRW